MKSKIHQKINANASLFAWRQPHVSHDRARKIMVGKACQVKGIKAGSSAWHTLQA